MKYVAHHQMPALRMKREVLKEVCYINRWTGARAGETATLFGSAIPLCKAGVEGPCADDATMRLSRPMCVAGALMAFACKNGDEKYRTSYGDRPVQDSSYGREAEKPDEDGEDAEETVEIICDIFCP